MRFHNDLATSLYCRWKISCLFQISCSLFIVISFTRSLSRAKNNKFDRVKRTFYLPLGAPSGCKSIFLLKIIRCVVRYLFRYLTKKWIRCYVKKYLESGNVPGLTECMFYVGLIETAWKINSGAFSYQQGMLFLRWVFT